MNYKDIQSALEALARSTYEFENLMEENGGEFTPEAEQLEAKLISIIWSHVNRLRSSFRRNNNTCTNFTSK